MNTIILDGVVFNRHRAGGILRVFNEILPRMCELDKELSIKILAGSGFQTYPQHAGISVIHPTTIIKYFRPWRIWHPYYSKIIRLYTKIKLGTNSKVWHSTYYTSLPWWQGPKVVTTHDFIHEKYPTYFQLDTQTVPNKARAISEADSIICVSNTTRQDLLEIYGVKPEKARVIFNGYNKLFRVKSEFNYQRSKPFVLYVGQRKWYKRFKDLLLAYSRWSSRKEVDLVVVGPPWDPTWDMEEIKLIEKLKHKGNVILLEQVSDEYLCDLYNQAVAYVHTSLYEGFGITLLEAMACGCPIVATHIPSTLEIANSIPIYYEPEQCDELLSALDEILFEGRNPVRIHHGLEHAKLFSWENTARQTLDLYYSLF